MTHLQEDTIFITGAGSGIGAETARNFVAKGWRVGLGDLDGKSVESLADELGPNAFAFQLDVVDDKTIDAALSSFVGPDAQLKVLFNSAGLLDMHPFADAHLAQLNAMIDVNVKGVIACVSKALPYLRTHGDARVITMSSSAAIYGVPDLAVYSASKFAVRGLTEALNVELEKLGIWVCDIMVGYVDTPMLADAEHKAKSVELAGIHVTPQMVSETVFQAVGQRQVHWFVREEDRAASDHFDATPMQDRRGLIAPATGY